MASRVVKRGVFEEVEDQENDLRLFSEIQSTLSRANSERSMANPAAVGLGAFGATTLLLQFHNLGFIGTGAVMWMAFFFGGLAQLVAGFQEFRTGNSFGFAAFTTYGAFWIALGGIWLNSQIGFAPISGIEVGWFLVVFTLLTGIYFIGSLKQNSALAWIFLTLLIGFILLDIGHLVGAGFSIRLRSRTDCLRSNRLVFDGPCDSGPFKGQLPAGKAWIRQGNLIEYWNQKLGE
jgi:succinate-acetate transporter protein